jgi:hypothetical protein
LDAFLTGRTPSLALIEVDTSNLGDVLALLTAAALRFPSVRFAALWTPGPQDRLDPATDRDNANCALLEAGAAMVLSSPRQVHALFDLARRQADFIAERSSTSANLTIETYAHSLLPWQDE